jgi:hypothetical protein
MSYKQLIGGKGLNVNIVAEGLARPKRQALDFMPYGKVIWTDRF